MGVWPVTVGALLEGQRFCEISARMTLRTIDLYVLAKQRKLCFGMLEYAIQPGRQDLAPASGGVTRLARLRKSSAVGIGMAIAAASKRDSRVTRLFVFSGCVALLTANFCVQTS
jgi:hypothetical protein